MWEGGQEGGGRCRAPAVAAWRQQTAFSLVEHSGIFFFCRAGGGGGFGGSLPEKVRGRRMERGSC